MPDVLLNMIGDVKRNFFYRTTNHVVKDCERYVWQPLDKYSRSDKTHKHTATCYIDQEPAFLEKTTESDRKACRGDQAEEGVSLCSESRREYRQGRMYQQNTVTRQHTNKEMVSPTVLFVVVAVIH